MAKRIEEKGTITGIENLTKGEGIEGYEYGSDLNVAPTPMIDPMEGNTVSIRIFEFKMNPDPKIRKQFPTNKQEVFNAHAKQIMTLLWADGLAPMEEVPPKVLVNHKNGTYQIYVPCRARLGQMFIEKAHNLSTHLNDPTRN